MDILSRAISHARHRTGILSHISCNVEPNISRPRSYPKCWACRVCYRDALSHMDRRRSPKPQIIMKRTARFLLGTAG